METIAEKHPEMKLVTFDCLISAFHEIVHSDYDLILVDCEIEGFQQFSCVKLIKAFNDHVPIIVTCTEEQKFIGLRSVVEGADNYYIIRYNYKQMLCKIIAISLNLIAPIDYIRQNIGASEEGEAGSSLSLSAAIPPAS